MRILLLGKNGQVGWELQRALATLGEIRAVDYPEIDFTHPDDLRELVKQTKPQVVVNAAAYTAVDRAESEPQVAGLINAAAPGVLAEAARKAGAAFVHYSTDYVFDGAKGSPYVEEDAPNPLNVYGQSKLSGEQVVESSGGAYLVLRTSWVFSTRRDSFVTKVLQWSRKQPVLKMVTDQVGSPTWARMLAETTAQLIAMGARDPFGWFEAHRGIYHLGGKGQASRLEWAREILANDPSREAQVAREVVPALTAEFPTQARRPLFTALDCQKFANEFGLDLPDWREALKLAMQAGY